MKKLLFILLLSMIAASSFSQTVKISAMPVATGNGSGGFLPIIKNGVNYKLAVDSLLRIVGGTIIINDTSTGLAYLTFNGNGICQHFLDSSFKCNNLDGFVDGAALSADTSMIDFYNDGNIIFSIPNIGPAWGLIWPLHYLGRDIINSKGFWDSLYISDVKKVGSNLYKYSQLGDSTFIGSISGGVTDNDADSLGGLPANAYKLKADSIASSGYATNYKDNLSFKTAAGITGGFAIIKGNGDSTKIIINASSPIDSTALSDSLAAYEAKIVASNTANKYWNGYKQFVSINTDSAAEGSTNLFFTNARARAAISLTTTGSSGASAYNSGTGILNVPNYTLAGLGGQTALSGTGYSKWSGSTPSYLTPTQVTADLDIFTSSLKGLVPASGGGTTNFLRADGTWAAAGGGGGGLSDSAYFWKRTGNTITPGSDFIGTLTNNSLRFRVNNIEKLRIDSLNGNIIQVHGTNSISIQNGLGGGTTTDRAISIGAGSATGVVSISLGGTNGVTGTGGVAIGYTAQSTTGIAISANATAAISTLNGVAIGGNTNAAGGVAIGAGSTTSSSGAIAAGLSALASSTNATSVGNGTTASGINSMALGDRASATHADAIAAGLFSKTSAANELVIGGFQAGGGVGIYNVYFGSGPKADQTTTTGGESFTINGSGGNGSNQNGGNITIAGGKGTGTGTGGDIILSTSVTGTTGSTLQSVTERLRLTQAGSLVLQATNTAGGTTGAQTINKPSGTVNFAAAATTLVVTNSLVTASSIVMVVIRTNDATATIKNVVPAAGSFTITLGAAATAETSVGFFVIN
jgi:hypothetical protein